MSLQKQLPVILCATARLARNVQLHLQRQQLQSGAKQWQPQRVLTLAQWLSSVIESSILMGEIDAAQVPLAELNPTQEALLWEQSIASSLTNHAAADLFDTSGLASTAIEANRLVIEWNINIDMSSATEETQQFMQWQQHFQSLCQKSGHLESVRYRTWQINCLRKDAGSMPEHIQLAGFDRINPQLKSLISVLKARNVNISTYQLTHDTTQKIEHILLNDQDAECRAAVAWAQAEIQQNPQSRLAIVVPELDVLRAKLSDLLDDTFHPQSAIPALAEEERCYDFSLGVPLDGIPVIQTALNLLRFAWQKRQIAQADIAQLLHSPYWSAHKQESHARAKLDARMRSHLPLNFSTTRLANFVKNALEGEYALPVEKLHTDLQQLLTLAEQQTRQQVPSFWASYFKQVLETTQWQGDRGISSHEYQAVQSFERVLSQLSNLDVLFKKISASSAIKRLTQLCHAQIFQPESKTLPTIQVMGMLEASAEPLDAIWVMGMNDHVWPPASRPNALIPAELQRKVGTPNASSEVQTEFARAVHQRLIKSATHVIFSSAAKDGDRQLRTSPLMQDISQKTSETTSVEVTSVATLAEQLAKASKKDWQWLDDQQAPPATEGEHISGGTALLKAQAICPAWAFYQYRLGARQLDEAVDGLNVMERGSLVHEVLAQFWQERSSQSLSKMSADTIQDTLKTISQQVLAAFNQEKNQAFSEIFLNLESERLVKLISTWLTDVEMLRPQGFTVSACEEKHTVTIEGIEITLVVDRIDTLDDDRLVLIDYKTGRQMDYKNWAQACITEPQLPIYAAFVLQDKSIAVVCYARVRTADHAFVGIAAEAGLIQGATVFNDVRGKKVFDEHNFPDWNAITQHWKLHIAATALALKTGDAAVKFEDENQLMYCDVLPLLRLPERQLQFEHQKSTGKTA